MDAGNLLKPMLGRGELRCIGATTLDEYRKYIEKDPALERRFQQVLVDQPSVQDAIAILRGLRERYELHHGVSIADSALVEAAVLSDRYIADRFLPDKAIDLTLTLPLTLPLTRTRTRTRTLTRILTLTLTLTLPSSRRSRSRSTPRSRSPASSSPSMASS